MWYGEFREVGGQVGQRSYAVAMFVSARDAETIDCKVWYPTLDVGSLALWRGKIDDKGIITFSSFDIVFGEGTRRREGLLKASGQITLRGTGLNLEGEGTLQVLGNPESTIVVLLKPAD